MGNWNISIHGTGCHHNNDYPADADRMAAEFVTLLRSKGHTVSHASITHGGECDITDSEKYSTERIAASDEFLAKKASAQAKVLDDLAKASKK
jgi:hypothetical protein